jgi:XrtN system VIT domain protein
MQAVKLKLKDSLYMTGIFSIIGSLFFFCIPFFKKMPEGDDFSLFVPCFAITIIYYIVFRISRKKIDTPQRIHYFFTFLILFLISAYALNRTIPVFDDSVPWLSTALVISCINYSFFSFFENISRRLKFVMFFIGGVSFTLFLYLSFYLIPFYAIGIAGFLLLGIPLHSFVPLLFTIYSFKLLRTVAADKTFYWKGFIAGASLSILLATTYVIKWSSVSRRINKSYQEASANKNGLPVWVNAAQTIPRSSFTEKILKTGFVYAIPNINNELDNFLWSVPQRGFDEPKKHDPLVTLAILFSGKPAIDNDDKIKLLESLFDARHKTQERLWSGDDLFTEKVNTSVRVWPNCNITYTEKTITVTNDPAKVRWRNSQEAIYTFYLSEGGVVTSLSLWVNGKEEKGILTTKGKADSAYKTIVGVESRDPSVVHWQEGNSVSVRVFPVIAGESRMFKLGITAPLIRSNGKLVYDNIYFDGPGTNQATETIQVDFEQPVKEFRLPVSFVSKKRQSYSYTGKYHPDWQLRLEDQGLTDCSFSFEKKSYTIEPYHKKLGSATINDIYLDINSAWTKNELKKIIELSKGKNIFVYNAGIEKITEQNKNELFERLNRNQFSLFPLFHIKDASQSLLITKGTGSSCNLYDIEKSGFMDTTRKYLATADKIRLFNLNNELSPYLKSLKEYRVFQYDQGDTDILAKLLQDSYFAEDTEDDSRVIINSADMIIKKTDEEKPLSGPDHIMRLFAYNHVMQQLGKSLLTEMPIDAGLVKEAQEAYVVTPVTSMVVLESQADYKRFDIKDTGSSLKNASLNSKGAVPEPHEWALIIIGCLVILYVKMKQRSVFNKA